MTAQPRLAWGLGGVTLAVAVAGVATVAATRTIPVPPGTDTVSAAFFLGWLLFAAVGVLLAVRRPRNAVGWIVLVTGLAWSLHGASGAYRILALAEQGGWPAGVWAAWAWDWSWIPAIVAVLLLPLRFPDGGLPSPRWRFVQPVLAAAAGLTWIAVALQPGPLPNTPAVRNPVGVDAIAGVAALLEGLGTLGFLVGGVAALLAPVVRYRHAGAVARAQLKWFAAAGVVVLAAWIFAEVLEIAGADPALLGDLRVAPLMLLPLAIAVAVLQHRLYDIDLVISKSLVYGSLALFIAAVYVGVVVGIGSLVGLREGAQAPLSIAATAIAAIAFGPLRLRLQALADRLVYGRRASPYEALASFTARMTDVAPGHGVLAEVARTVAEAVGADAAEVWLRSGPELRRAARWPAAASQTTAADRPATIALAENGDGTLRLPGVDRTYPVRRSGRLLGALAVATPRGERLRPAEDALLADLASAAWLLLDNVALVDELRASRQRLVTAQDTERTRIERDLHDGAQQRLLELALTLRAAREEAAARGAEDVVATVDAAQEQLRAALSELREFARGIRPAILSIQGLGPALESLAERAPLPVTVEPGEIGRQPAAVEATAYFVASEALANVLKHARASAVTVAAAVGDGRLRLAISDDGVGGADPAGSGLQGLADRVAALDGRLRVDSPPGGGTRVEVELPCG